MTRNSCTAPGHSSSARMKFCRISPIEYHHISDRLPEHRIKIACSPTKFTANESWRSNNIFGNRESRRSMMDTPVLSSFSSQDSTLFAGWNADHLQLDENFEVFSEKWIGMARYCVTNSWSHTEQKYVFSPLCIVSHHFVVGNTK